MSVENPSVEELSDNFLRERSHLIDEDKIEVKLKDVQVYPSHDNPTLVFSCGFPLNEYYLRIDLDELHEKGFKKVLSFYPDKFTGLESIVGETVEIEMAPEKRKNMATHRRHLELPFKCNGEDVHLCKFLRQSEYHVSQNYDMENLTKRFNNALILYTKIEQNIEKNEGIPVKDIESSTDRSFVLEIGYDTTMPIEVKLPDLANINNHPVTKFIDNFGSGKIENIKGVEIYVGKKDGLIGQDKKYNLYGIYESYDSSRKPKSSNGLISAVSKFF